jgi:endosialidase-like protein
MGKSPKPPDPYATAQAQGNANFMTAQQNAIMGNVNEYTPYGNKTYQQIGWDPVYDSQGRMSYAPRYQSNIQLSPDQERLLGQQTGMQYNLGNLGLSQSSRLQSLLGHEMNTEGLTPWANYRRDAAPTNRPAIENAMMASYHRATDPQARAQEAQMAARGLSPGSQGYGTMQQGVLDAQSEAARQAYLASGQESRAAEAAYNQSTSLMNNLRQGQLQERVAIRNQPINEIMALLGGSGVTTPQFQPFASPNVPTTNIGQMIYDNYNARAQQSANNMSGMFGVGANIAGALPWASWLSDRRLKYDIHRLERTLAGIPLYFFRFKHHKIIPEAQWGRPHIGVMADEVRPIWPDAVKRLSDGYDRVNYEMLLAIEETCHG